MVIHPQLAFGDMAEEGCLYPVVEHKVYKIPFLIVVDGNNGYILCIAVQKLLICEIGVPGNIKAEGIVPAALDQRLEYTFP